MANTVIELRHSRATGNVPTSLANGELAINTYDGKLFYRGGVSNTIQTITRFTGPAGLDTEVQFNDSGSLGGSEKLTFNKTTGLLTVNGTVRANIFSDDGVDLYDFSNTAFNTANAAFLAANVSTAVNVTQNNSIAAAFIQANSAFNAANTFSSDYFPTTDWGNLTDTTTSSFGESLIVIYDTRVEPITPQGYFLTKDFGYVP